MSDFWWKRLRQNGHANGRMSPWMSRCVLSVDDRLKRFSQTPHRYGRADPAAAPAAATVMVVDPAASVPAAELLADHAGQLQCSRKRVQQLKTRKKSAIYQGQTDRVNPQP